MNKKADSAQTKKNKREIYEPKRSNIREIFEILMYGLALLIFCKGFIWQNFQIPTPSMENSLLIGDHITANTFVFKGGPSWEKAIFPFREVQRGDVVVFKWPGDARQDWIKRCVGLPGDRFELISDRVYIDGDPLKEVYPYYKTLPPENRSDRDPDNKNRPMGYDTMKPGIETAQFLRHESVSMETIRRNTLRNLTLYKDIDPNAYRRVVDRLNSGDKDTIPEGFYFMMGDNRNRSMDSRSWGLVPREFVQGRAYWIWWSYGEEENSHKRKGLDLIWSYVRVPFRFFTHTRWDQTFKLIK